LLLLQGLSAFHTLEKKMLWYKYILCIRCDNIEELLIHASKMIADASPLLCC